MVKCWKTNGQVRLMELETIGFCRFSKGNQTLANFVSLIVDLDSGELRMKELIFKTFTQMIKGYAKVLRSTLTAACQGNLLYNCASVAFSELLLSLSFREHTL